MRLHYEIGKSIISEEDMHKICNEIIELLKNKKITLAVANAILLETQELIEQKSKENLL